MTSSGGGVEGRSEELEERLEAIVEANDVLLERAVSLIIIFFLW